METKTKILITKSEVKRLILACKKTGYCCFDFETNAEPLYNKSFKPTILSISFQPGTACSVVLDHFQRNEYKVQYTSLWVIKKIGHDLIEDDTIVKCAWNLKFDAQVFMRYNIFYRGTCIDGMLAKYILNEEKPNDLKSMVRRYLPESGDYEKADNFDKIPWDEKELEPLCHYGGQDTDYTLRLCIFFEQKLISLGLYSLFRNMIMSASRVLTTVERNGLYLDRDFNNKLLEEYKVKINELLERVYNLPKVKKFSSKYQQSKIDLYINSIQDEIYVLREEDADKNSRKILAREQKIANIRARVFTTKKEQSLIARINLGSPVDLPALIYGENGFRFKCTEFTDKGKQSTSEDTLKALRLTVKDPESPKAIFLDTLMDLRGLEKMYTTFIEGWHDKVQDDNKLHGQFKIIGTTSGRLSSAEPNLQQIPKVSVDPNIKKQLIAKPGTLYLSSDFSQAELRIMAHLSKDETYLRSFNNGEDPHLAIACQKYHVDYNKILPIYKDEQHPEHKIWSVRRKQAKQLAFGLIYGIGPGLLAEKLSDPKAGIIVSKEEAKKQMDEYFEEHPALERFKEKQERALRKHGFLTSLFGRKRRLPQIYSENTDEEAYAIRLGLNFPCLLPSSQALSKTDGWVNYTQLRIGDEILAFNPETGKTEWQPVLMVNVYDYDGDMVRLKTKHLDVMSTPDHRWYVSKPNKISILTKLEVKTADELYQSNKAWSIPIRAPHNNTNKKIYSNSLIAFIGWYLTDGHLMKRGNIRITQSMKANPHKVKLIESIVKKLGVRCSSHYSHHGDTIVFTILDRKFVNKVVELTPNKELTPEFLFSLPQHQLYILLENLRLGDGWSIFATSKPFMVGMVQALVVLCNNTSSAYELSHKGDRSYFKTPTRYGQEYVESQNTSYGIKFSNFRKSVNTKNTYNDKNNLSKEYYHGKVWCPTVPSGAFVTRVIGDDKRYRTIITGNCQSAASDMCLFGSILIYYLMRQGKLPRMDSVTLVHDANYMNTLPENINVWSLYSMWEIFRNPSTKEYFGFQINDITMDMDYHVGRTMAEELPIIPGYDYRKMLDPNFSVDEYMEEYKMVGEIPIQDYPKLFPKEMAYFKEQFKLGKYGK